MAMKAPDPDSGEMPGMQGMQMRQVTVEEGDVVRVDFPEGQTTSLLVEGTLMRGGVPVPSAQMMWRPAKLTGLDMQSATTGSDGSFEVTLPKPGQYKIGIMFGELDVVAGRMNTATIEAEVTNDNALGLVVTVPEGTLAGSVSDAQTGEALASARVHAFKRQDDGTFEATHMVMADDEGLFEVEALGAGEYAMTIVAPGKAAEVVGPMDIDDDEELDDMDLRLAPSAPLGVRVRSTSGQPLDGMIVFPVVDGDLAVPWTVVTSFTDASGATWVRELPQGIWSLAIVGQGAPITVVEDVEIGREERTIEVEIGRASTVEISLVDADGTPVPDAELFVAEKEGRDLTWILKNAVVSRRSRIGLTTDEAGRIAVEELGPGTYELRMRAPDGREASDVVRLAEGETVSVDLALD
jgi:protocatechuate 3,4-dioxygenase beta subunit